MTTQKQPLSHRLITLVSILFLLNSFVHSQHIKHLGIEEGLTSRHTFNVTQDKKGFIWIAGRFGIDRYDGKNIKHYPMEILYSGVHPFRVTNVTLDRDSCLWAFTNRGTIYQYDENRDEFIFHSDTKHYLLHLHFDENNNIWTGANSSIVFIDRQEVKFISSELLRNKDIKAMVEYENNSLLIVISQNIFRLNKETQTVHPFIDYTLFESPDIHFRIETCYFDRINGKIWFGTLRNSLFIYDIQEKNIRQVEDTRLFYHPVLTITDYDNDLLLIGTEGTGMCVINKQTYTVEHIYNQWSPKNTQISGDAVYGIFKDNEKKIWVSTFSSGINIVDFTETSFHTITHEKNNENSLCSNIVCDMLEDKDGNLWFATDNGLSQWNPQTNIWKRFLESKNIVTIHQDKHENIWAGVYSAGIYIIDKKGNLIEHIVKQNNNLNSLRTDFIYTITEDTYGNFWIGGKKGETTKYNPTNKKFTRIPVAQTNYILQKDDKHMLISSEAGVYQVSIETHEVEECRFNTNLKSYYISDMYLESDSIVWLATYGDGINRCNLYTGTIRHFTQKNSLNSNIVYSLLSDNENQLFFSSENGMGILNTQTFQVTNFSGENGIGNDFRQISRLRCKDGKMFFGSHEGALWFYPENLKQHSPSGKLFFQEFSLFNQIMKAEDKNSPLSTSIDNTTIIKLKHTQHSFSINFTAIDFMTNVNRRYTWILEGVDKTWIPPTAEYIANYTNIPPGHYTFKVKYLDENKQAIDTRELQIIVSPPFWKTGIAKTIQLLLLIVLISFIYRYIKHRIKKKQSEEKIKFFINTAHDLRTPLTLINSPIYQLKEEVRSSEKTDYLFNLITDNLNKLNQMFSQLLDFEKAYESEEQLVVRERSVNKFLNDKALHWNMLARKKEINFSLEMPEKELMEWFDIEKMERILDNLVSNAIKYTPQQGEVKIKLTNETAHWQIAVTDTGIGISKNEKENLFKRFYRASNAINSQETGSGLGLLLIKQYVTLHKGTIKVNSIENKGSEFYVQFPHGKKSYEEMLQLDDYNIPIIDDQIAMGEEEQEALDKLRIKVLIVEDNNDLRTYLKLSLNHYYRVYTATNGKEAWDNMMKISPDIVVSDLQMPEIDGFELIRKIKSTFETSHIPVILLTVVNDKTNITKGFNLGADDYIEKPFNIEYLRMKVDNIIQNRKILRLKFLGINKQETEEKEKTNENDFNTEFVRKAKEIIERNLTNSSFSISDFSKEMGLSRTLLYTKFNTITGYTPNDFIKITKMNKAIQYFGERKYSINEVAFMVGFEEPAYFSTSFKKIYGKSPKQFIEENFK